MVLDKGKTQALTATVKPDNTTDKTVTWSNSDTGVAGVDGDGKVTVVNKGTAKITARTSNGKTAECEVLVRDTAVTEGVPGAEYQSKEIGDPNWQDIVRNGEQAGSSNLSRRVEAIAVRILPKGTPAPGKLGTGTDCYVAGVPATSATLDKTSANLTVGSSLQLNATVAPENVTLKKHGWSSSDKSVATVSSTGKVTAGRQGDGSFVLSFTVSQYVRSLSY